MNYESGSRVMEDVKPGYQPHKGIVQGYIGEPNMYEVIWDDILSHPCSSDEMIPYDDDVYQLRKKQYYSREV